MDTYNILLAKQLNVSRYHPMFQIGVPKIIFLYDFPDVIKAICNTLLKYNLIIGSKIISWKHFKTFHNIANIHSDQGVPKVTDANESEICR